MEKTIYLFLCCALISVGEGSCPERGEQQLEEGRTCKKKQCRDDSDCTAANKGCFCDSECGLSCFNKNLTCGELPSITSGRVRTTNLTFGGEARYRCNNGYVLRGRKKRKCNADKKWGGNAPTCILNTCSRPYDVANSYPLASGEFRAGRSYDFSCSTGFYLRGNPSRTCLSESAGWSSADFSCSMQQCDGLPDVYKGRIEYTNDNNFGSTATVVCDEGYEPTSGAKKRCYPGDRGSAYGEWRGSLPSCQIITCERPTPPDHGTILHLERLVPEYGIQIMYECDSGYKIKGSDVATCNKDRNWGEVPECVENADCQFTRSTPRFCGYTARNWIRVLTTDYRGLSGHAAVSEQGRSTLESITLPEGWADNSICLSFRYKLSRGRTLHVESVNGFTTFVTTHKNEEISTWLNAAVTIDARRSVNFRFRTNGDGVYLDDIFVARTACDDHCKGSPCRNGGTCFNRKEDYTCFCTKFFEGRNCQSDLRCQVPSERINHGSRTSLSGNLLPRSGSAMYECDAGYRFANGISTKNIDCIRRSGQRQGQWSPSLSTLRCEEIFCRPPASARNRRLLNPKAKFLVGDIAEYQCKSGYIALDASGRSLERVDAECLYNRLWSNEPPQCIRPHCLYKENSEKNSPSIFNRLEKYPVGSRVYFKCEVGFKIVGQSSRRCVEMKRWDGHEPQCRKIECSRPPVIDNGRYISNGYSPRKSYSHGEFLEVGCNAGHFLQGPRKITCLWNRTWSEHPRCSHVSNHCRAFQNLPDNSEYVERHGNRVIIKCKDLYEPSAKFKLHCGSDGQWQGERPTCHEVLPSAFGNFDGLQYLVYGEAGRGNYSETQQFCRNIGGNLAVIPNWRVHDKIVNQVLYKMDKFDDIIIGMVKREGKFDWDTDDLRADLHNQRMHEYSRWRIPQDRNQRNRNCVMFYSWPGTKKENVNRWYKTFCHVKFRFMCQRDQHPCKPNPCKNHGRCVSNQEGVSCECTEKYTGTYCEEEIKCDFTPFIRSGFKSLTREYYSVGERVPLICDEGFARSAGEARCLRNGRWSYRGTCRVMTCENPPLPHMGLVEGDESLWKAGDVTYIKCKVGYELHGKNIMQCQLDGTWTELEGAECRAIECDRPRLPQEAQLATDKEVYSIGENVEVSCNEGYELAGASSLECQQDKTWSPAEAQVVCNVQRNYPCNAPDPPDNAVFDNDGETFPTGTSITFHCRDGYVLLGGDPTWTCENGRWTKTNAACDVGEPCSHPDLPTHSFIVDGVQEFPSGTTISFGCRNERRLSENAPWSCNNGEWTKTDFTCIAQNCLLDRNHLGLYGFGIANMELQGDQRFPIGQQLTLTCLYGGTPRHKRDEATRPRMICRNDGTWAPSYKGFAC